jgi:hypothetical protein
MAVTGLAVMASALLAACDFLSMEYIPRADDLRRNHSTFMIAESNLRGVYGNVDVESVIFTYTSAAQDSDEFWDAIHENAESAGWKLTYEEPDLRRYERIIPRTGYQVLHSAEETRIAYNSTTKVVTVAWVQAYPSTLPDRFSDTGEEATWAEEAIWPQFRRLLAQ